jgi:DNA replication protein DnaC
MIAEQTLDKMRRMRMNHLAQTLREICDNPAYNSLAFEDRIGLLIDAEWEYRRGHKTSLLGKRAGFTDPTACVEAIDYRPERGLNKQTILSLATCGYIDARQDILILGKTGVGKSFIAQALGLSACRNHHPVRYTRTASLLDDLAVAATTGGVRQALDSYIKPALLILDDYMLTQPTRAAVDLLLELTEKRLHTGSTIYCSQLPPEQWHERIEEKIIADAICDRVINRSHIIEIHGDSMRRHHRPAR